MTEIQLLFFNFFFFFCIEYIRQEVLKKSKITITHNIFRIQCDGSVICGFYCIAFTKYMIAGKTLLDYSVSYDYKKNGKIIQKRFKKNVESLNFMLKQQLKQEIII